MKKNTLPSLLLLTLLCGCRSQTTYYVPEDVVNRTYVHKYGLELPAEDWSSRGQSGQVITTLDNGVKVTHSYADGQLHGDCWFTYPHSEVVQKIETYDRGNRVRVLENNTLGMPHQETRFNESRHPTITTWYESGSPKSVEQLENNRVINGTYYNINHQVESSVIDGDGLRTLRDSYGHLLSRDTIHNGEMVNRETYYPNGAPQSNTTFRNGRAEGQRKTYLPTGEPVGIEQWSNDKQNGVTIVYQNGEKFAEVPYVDGYKEGVEKRYKAGNILVEEITWKRGQRHGPSYTYVEGNVKGDWYYKDKPVTKTVFEQMTKASS